jgi:SAM-dependent methyltransferase
MSEAVNAGQRAYWNGPQGRRWITMQERMDRVFEAATMAAVDAAGVQPGERVLDVGCGCGATVLALAARVGAEGRVLGVDISEPMLGRAAEQIAAAGYGHAATLVADAASHAFEPGSFDLVFSRFGVMFFGDPVAAFANLRRAASGGRLVFLCFRPMPENEWVRVPYEAASPLLPPTPPPDPGAPQAEEVGQFAFADPARVMRILEGAGWRHITLAPLDTAMRLAEPGNRNEAVEREMEIGAVARALLDAEASLIARVREAIDAAFAAVETPSGVMLGAGMWLVSARA